MEKNHEFEVFQREVGEKVQVLAGKLAFSIANSKFLTVMASKKLGFLNCIDEHGKKRLFNKTTEGTICGLIIKSLFEKLWEI